MAKSGKPKGADLPPDDTTEDDDLLDLADPTPDVEEEEEVDRLAPPQPADEILEPPVERPPQLPVQLAGYLEYSSPDKEGRWRCERATDLLTDYKITGTNNELEMRIEEWHKVMSSQGGVSWMMLRRWYRCAPLTGAIDPDDLKEWTLDTLAQKMGVSAPKLTRALEETVEFWDRVQLEKALATKMLETSGIHNLDETAIKQLVEKHGFQNMPPQEYPYIGLRITEMSNLFELPEGRMLAQTAIFQELMLRNCQKSIGRLMALNSDGKELESKLNQLKALQSSYEGTMEKLGATQEQNPSFRQRVAFNDSLGQITRAMQAFYGDKDNTIIDGVFTMSEVKLLLTPTTLRPSQYRPDLVLLAQDWKAHFWNTDYEALTLPRDQHRRLMRAFDASLAAQRSDEGEPIGDMDQEGDDILEIAEGALKTAEAANLPGEDIGGSMPDADAAILPDEAVPPSQRKGRIPSGSDVVAI